jgi:hypothetical protein
MAATGNSSFDQVTPAEIYLITERNYVISGRYDRGLAQNV